jgi:class 3 adenylate cyclase
MALEYPYHSLEDFLAGTMTHVDAVLDDGWGASFPVKGREIEATVLFADIASFSARTMDMTPTETLIFVNNFFAWISAEALRGRPGIVDKYIGDEVMVVYSKEFGSEDPFLDAVQGAIEMANHDVLAYGPHIGIASGRVMVGYVGTAMRYSVSVFGAPVAMAARCAAVRPTQEAVERVHWISSSIVVPESEWHGRPIADVLPPASEAGRQALTTFTAEEPRTVEVKGLGEVEVREIFREGGYFGGLQADDRARDSMQAIIDGGRFWPPK